MKRLTTLVVLSVIVMGTATAQTQSTTEQATFFATSEKDIYQLVVDTPDKSKVSLNIYNSERQRVYTDRIGKYKGFTKKYDFSRFPIGEYSIEVEKNGTILETALSHFEKAEPQVPFFVRLDEPQGDKVDLRVIGADNRLVEVTIKSVDGEIIYVDRVSGLAGFRRTYNLKRVGTNVAFQVRVDDQVINKNL